MKLKVYVLDLEIPARTKRRALLVGIPLGILLGGAGIVYATVPNVFAVGDPLSSAKVNQNFSSLDTRVTALEGAPAAPSYVWSWHSPANNISASSAGQIASMTFTPPAAGFALVTAHYGTVILNDNGAAAESDCHVTTQLSLTGGQVPSPTLPGYQDVWVNGNLPTQYNGGTYLDFNQSASIVVPVSAAATTVYLNGQINVGTTGCQSALWRTITIDAIFFQNNPTATGTTY
jgi:hypothetical protein